MAKSPKAAKTEVISLSWLKSANKGYAFPTGKVDMGLSSSNVWLTEVWSFTAVPVRRAMSSFTYPTPWVGPRAFPGPKP